MRSNREVAHCLDYYAHVSRVAVPHTRGLIGPMVRAWFRDGTEVRAWFYASPAAARAARPVGAFEWNATRSNVAYEWNREPSLGHRVQLKFCITPVQAQRIACSYPVVPGVPEVKPQRCLVHRPRASTQPTRTTTVHSVLVAQGGRG